MSRPRVAAVIPAYNEAARVGEVVAGLRAAGRPLWIIVVDDGSGDATAAAAAGADVVLRHVVNLGIGAAVESALRRALADGCEAVIRLDADGQHRPAEIEALLAPVLAGEADLVIGSRFLEAGGFRSTFIRRVGIRLLSAVVRGLTGRRIHDVTSGFRAYGRPAAALSARGSAIDYPEADEIVRMLAAGLRIEERPVRMMERVGGLSSIQGLGSAFYMAKVTLSMLMARLRAGRGGGVGSG